ncbi:bifunctional ATP-dependent DNA helicase/ssDNA endodeoxyribonuclease DNA2 PWA37_002379 [Arxiozyma heterogenica]|uniref:bifunctional ATP-dependent DNA helicase/ssDNA endodeoxyribonuclease DNA2 n=1 Tax=Arxiozyma heterogenica TaxID=278026 RepID=UPI002F1C5EB5
MTRESNKSGKGSISNDGVKELNPNINDPSTIESISKGTVNKRRTNTSSKGTKRYKFAVIDNISGKKSDSHGVLKSISVSQIRNTAVPKKIPMEEKNNIKHEPNKKNNSQDLENKNLHDSDNISKKKDSVAMIDHETVKLRKSLGEMSPPEEVVWQFNPDDKLPVDKTTSTVEMSDDIDRIDNNLRNPSSSTPLFNNRLKGILDFNNISEHNKQANIKEQQQEAHKKNGLEIESVNTVERQINGTNLKMFAGDSNTDLNNMDKYETMTTNTKLLRDIDDILNDIKGDISIKLRSSLKKSQKFKDIPSSPLPIGEQYNARDLTLTEISKGEKIDINTNFRSTVKSPTGSKDIPSKHNDTYLESDEDDDLIMEMLTQNLSPKKPSLEQNCSFNSENMSKKIYIQNHQGVGENNKDKITSEINMNNDNILKNEKSTNNVLSGDPSGDPSDDSLLDYFDVSKSVSDTSTVIAKNTLTKNNKKPMVIKYNVQKEIDNINYIERAKWCYNKPGVVRLVIVSIRQMNIPNIGEQKILTGIDGAGKTETVILRSPWVYLKIKEGDIVHIIEGKNFANKRLLSDAKDPQTQLPNDNLLILHPDLLLSATTIGSAIQCQRSSFIQLLFQDTRGEVSLPMTIGNIVHEILQSCLKYKLENMKLTNEYIEQKLDELLEIYSFAIIVCDETIDNVRKEIIKTHLNNILTFINKFVTKSNFGCYVSISGTRRTTPLSILDVIDIEENIWSPVYGFKGFLDATVIARRETSNFLVPLEVKTGKLRSIAHEAQGLIYTLLLHDRYDIAFNFFLLYYTRDSTMTEFPFALHSIKHIIMLRNRIAMFLQYRLTEINKPGETIIDLPPLNECSFCERCGDRIESLILHTLLGDSTTLDDIGVEDYSQLTAHLKANLHENRYFFRKYNDLITKEESSITSQNQQLYLKDSVARELEDAITLSYLVISNFSSDSNFEGQYIYTFSRNPNYEAFPPLSHSQIYQNDPVFISDEVGNFALAQGYVIEITASQIVISTKRQLITNKQTMTDNSKNINQSVISVLHPVTSTSQAIQSQNYVNYRIDKNNIQQDLSTSRFNLLNLFLPPVTPGIQLVDEKTGKTKISKRSDGGDEVMRKILIDKVAPTFVSSNQYPHVVYDESCLDGFNENQVKAIDQALRCDNYSLILGMPGTGKTTVIAELIQILVTNGKSILLTSYTHSAVDNILLKLLNSDINIVRLGSKFKVNPLTQKFMPNYEDIRTYKEYIDRINNISVVATTCLGINDLLFSLRTKDFDYVILDEASQVSLPIALGPLRYGNRFIMVGDHFQLPPLVKNNIARENGLEESLFKILSKRHPESVVELTYQYRMCGDIVKLSNYLIYNGKLKCGSDEVYNQSLDISDPTKILSRYKRSDDSNNIDINNNNWLSDILTPSKKVIFLNYDKIPTIVETYDGDNITNKGEVELTKLCLEGMLRCEVKYEDIGIMPLYRAQLRLLKRELQEHEINGLEILTADQFQGRDKRCVIISMVRCNKELHGGALLKELRRVNVAMTRAKCKLIIIGSKRTIENIKELTGFMKLLEDNKWIYWLPSNSLDVYDFTG